MNNITKNPIFTMPYDDFINSPEHRYYINVKEHIKNVQYGYTFIKNKIPSMFNELEISVDEMDKQIQQHDQSKFSPEEFEASAQYYYGSKDEYPYKAAWDHHWRHNPHHPEYWQGQDMPYSCLLEMLCDLWSFGWKDLNLHEIFDYWNKNRDEKQKIMSEASFNKFESMLDILKTAIDNRSCVDFKKIKIMVDSINESVSAIVANKNFKIGKKEAVDAVISSRVRHKFENDAREELDPWRRRELNKIKDSLSGAKDEHLVNLVKAAENTNDRISIDIHDDDLFARNTKSITADFDNESHMSLHTIRGHNHILDRNQKGRTKSTGYGENDEFIKYATGKDIDDVIDSEVLKLKKKNNLLESDLSAAFWNDYGE